MALDQKMEDSLEEFGKEVGRDLRRGGSLDSRTVAELHGNVYTSKSGKSIT